MKLVRQLIRILHKHSTVFFNLAIFSFFLVYLIVSAFITKSFGLIYSLIFFGALTFMLMYFTWFIFKLFLKTTSYRGKFYKQFINQIEENKLALKDILIKQSKVPNACAFGICNTKCITFFSRTLDICTEEELKGILAHEIGHHKNHDPLILSSNVYLVFAVLSFINSFLLDRNSSLVLFLIFSTESFISLVYYLAFSRWRESKADEYAMQSLESGEPLASFLEKAAKHYEKSKGIKLHKNPKNGEEFFYTHPWIFDRIKKLRQSAQGG